jgi:AraC-like DNA-binding protein
MRGQRSGRVCQWSVSAARPLPPRGVVADGLDAAAAPEARRSPFLGLPDRLRSMARRDTANIAHYWWDRHVRGLSLMHADFHTQEFAPHRHQGFVVAVTELGGSVIKSRGAIDQADAATLYVFNPDEPHAGWMGASRHWRYRSLYVEQDAINAIARGLGIDTVPYFTQNRFTDGELIRDFLALHRSLQSGRDALQQRELLIGTFGSLFSRHGGGPNRIEPAPRDRHRLNAALDVLRAEADGPPLLEELSEVVGLTQYQLIRLFKRATGLTPHAYIIQLRLDAARRYLSQGVPICDAAVAAGFYDQSALTRYFRRCYGVTPAQFVRAARPTQ